MKLDPREQGLMVDSAGKRARARSTHLTSPESFVVPTAACSKSKNSGVSPSTCMYVAQDTVDVRKYDRNQKPLACSVVLIFHPQGKQARLDRPPLSVQ